MAHGYKEDLVHLYIIGGGGCLLRHFSYLLEKGNVIVISDICANAKGYEALAEMKQRMKRKNCMRKTYKSSNVRFCMEDENQRRTWEYLQSLTRKDSPMERHFQMPLNWFWMVGYLTGMLEKQRSLFLPIESQESFKGKKNIPIGKKLSRGVFHDGLKVTAEHIEESVADRISKMQRAILRQLTKELEEQALRTVSVENTLHREQYEEETEQVPETDMSDAMMSMALAMGE